MKQILLSMSIFLGSQTWAQTVSPADYWLSLSKTEKVAFINGAYSMASRLKSHHKHEVNKQYRQDLNWVEPYYIERFYAIVDEHLSQKIGYDLDIIAQHMDALYANYDNTLIPIIEAVRIVSLAQDSDTRKADLLLLQAQRKYRP